MTYPVTLVESNPVTDILHTGYFDSSVRTNYTGQELAFGEETTFGRQLTFVFLTGHNEPSGAGNGPSALSFHLQGRRQNTGTWDIVPGKIVQLGSDTEFKIAIMYVNDHQLRQLGIDESGVPFDRVRYLVSCAGGACFASIYVVTGDLRFGLFGTNAQIASQMNDKGLDTTIAWPAEPWVYVTPEVIK